MEVGFDLTGPLPGFPGRLIEFIRPAPRRADRRRGADGIGSVRDLRPSRSRRTLWPREKRSGQDCGAGCQADPGPQEATTPARNRLDDWRDGPGWLRQAGFRVLALTPAPDAVPSEVQDEIAQLTSGVPRTHW